MQDEKGNGPGDTQQPPVNTALTKTGGPPTVPPVQPQAPLDVLLNSAAPLANAYCQHEERMQQRELEFEEKMIAKETHTSTVLIISGAAVAIVVLGLAGYLFVVGRDE